MNFQKSSTILLKFLSLLALLIISATGCNLLLTFPQEQDQKQRFQQIPTRNAPIKAPLKIHWDSHAIPYIEAQNNQDLAFGIGLVHAHLRLGQLEMLRHISQGRIGELAGPIPQITLADHGLRMLDFCRSGERAYQSMTQESQQWMRQFVAGINWYVENIQTAPVEYQLFSLKPSRFTVNDLACISRLVSTDLTWVFYLKFLQLAEKPGWEQALAHSLDKRLQDTASYKSNDDPLLTKELTSLSKSGSNSLVIGKNKSATGSALIASDPHVGLILPNFWLLVGLHSPDFHAVGLMIPGVPAIGVGRNEHIAWGGTNMRGISTHLVDVSELPKDQISYRQETLKRRWWFDHKITIRETEYGPILTDLPLFDQEKQPFVAALDWVGYRGSDELSAFLNAARATNWQEFRESFRNYWVSAYNVLYADAQGNIGMIPAYGQPVLKKPEATLEFIKPLNNTIQTIRSPLDQPNPFNPPEGYISSANNKPFDKPNIPYGFAFSNSDRVERMQTLVGATPKVDIDNLKAWQQDTYSASAHRIKEIFRDRIPNPVASAKGLREMQDDFYQWDGNFTPDSRGAAIFEALTFFAWQDYATTTTQNKTMQAYLLGIDNWKPELTHWLQALPEKRLTEFTSKWLAQTDDVLAMGTNWGDLQRQVQTSPLGVIPFIGHRFRRDDYPASGYNDTLYKAGRQHGPEVQDIFYGSSARHVSDMASLDENYFVLHGGQDGWLMNPNLSDQTELWRQGKYIQMPLNMENVRKSFSSHKTEIYPRN